jgi:hypothetical protein
MNRYMASLYAPNLYPDGRPYDASGSAIEEIDAKAPIASPTLTGVPAAPTAAPGTSTTQLATTAFVTVADNLKAPLASPTFTGVPAAPTASAATSTTQVATTAFVTTADNLKANLASPTFTGTVTLPVAIAVGALTEYADDSAAASGGLAVGRLYRTGSAIKVRVA